MQHAFAQMAPEGETPSSEMVCLYATEGLPYKAITEGTPWALVINGMSLHPNGLWALRRIGVKVAVWFTEAPYEVQEHHLAQVADLAFTSERSSVAAFQGVLDGHTGGKAVYLPHAYNPEVHHPLDGGEPPIEKHDVVLVGTGFLERQWLLENVDWEGIDLCLGGLWPGIEQSDILARYRQYSCLANEDTVKLYHGAKIVLNPHRWAPSAESLNPRAYEAAACGAFQITDRRAEVEELFGDSVPSYEPGNPWQLEALIRHYLEDSEGRVSKAKEANRKVQGHNFTMRAETIIRSIREVENGNTSR
jgi:spore maturation protein CgeB